MKTGKNLFAGIFVFLMFVFFASPDAKAFQGDCKQAPWHEVLAEVDKNPDKAARDKIFEDCRGQREITQKDKDAWLGALDSKNKDVQLRAVRVVRSTKDPRAIKKLVNNVRLMDVKNMGSLLTELMDKLQLKKVEEDITMPVEIIYLLGDLKDEEALPVIVEKLGDVRHVNILIDVPMQNVLVEKYGAMSLPHVASRIEKINDKQSMGRQLLLDVILYMRGKENVDELRKLSASDNLDIRVAANSALSAMHEKGDLGRIFKDMDEATANRKAFQEEKISYKKPSKKEDAEFYRLMAVENRLYNSLAESKNTDAVPIFIERIEAARKHNKGNFMEDLVVWNYLHVIGKIGGPEAAAFMKRAYEEIPAKTNIRYKLSFLSAFGCKGFVEAVPFFEGIMNDTTQDKQLREVAAIGLRDITGDSKYMRIYDEIHEGKR